MNSFSFFTNNTPRTNGMLNKIINTVGSRMLMTVLSFLLVLATTHFLAVEVRGEVSIFVLNVTLVVNFNNFVGGPSLVYLIPRHSTTRLLVLAIPWALLSSLLISAVLWLTGIASQAEIASIFGVGLLQSISGIFLMVLLGKDRIKAHNLLSFSMVAITLSSFVAVALWVDQPALQTYILAMYVAQGAGVLLGFILCLRYLERIHLNEVKQEAVALIRYGFMANVGSIAQLLNFRLSYYILEKYAANGLQQVGIYGVGVTVSEALWLVSRSISLVQYAAISNLNNVAKARQMTVTLLKFNFIATTILMIPALLVPPDWYAAIFGKPEFRHVPHVMLYLGPGILAFAAAGSLSHYFSGTGKHHINAWASAFGLVGTTTLGFLIIPTYGWTGAALTTAASLMLTAGFLFAVFVRESGFSLRVFFPGKEDFQQFKNLLQRKISGEKQE